MGHTRLATNASCAGGMKKIKNGVDLWEIVDPCPEEF
jgi:hypothetical protein